MMVCRSSRASLPLNDRHDRHDRLEGVWKKPKVRYFNGFSSCSGSAGVLLSAPQPFLVGDSGLPAEMQGRR
jgi:hypothetical protein